MKLKELIWLIFIVFTVVTACNKDDKAPVNLNKDKSSVADDKGMDGGNKAQTSLQDNNGINSLPEAQKVKMDFFRFAGKGEKPLAPEVLEMALPLSIQNFEKLPTSRGVIQRGAGWNTVSAQYLAKPSGFISIAVNDYGGHFPEEEIPHFSNLPYEQGLLSEHIEYTIAKGYKMWNENDRRGRMGLLIGNRFSVKIEADRLPMTIPEIDLIFPLLRFDLIHERLLKQRK